MQSRADSPGTGVEAALLTWARELLDDLPKWRLPHAAWSRPAAAVEALAVGTTRGTGSRSKSPSPGSKCSARPGRWIASPTGLPPAAEPLQEQVTALVHMIAESAESAKGEADGDEGR
jgi:hypothetical protein